MNTWRFPLQFSLLCSGGYIAVLLLQHRLQSPSSLDSIWLLLEWWIGPLVGLSVAYLGWRELEHPTLRLPWKVFVVGLYGALCGAVGAVPFMGWRDCFPGSGIGIGLTVLLGCGFGWRMTLLSGMLVSLMTLGSAASLPAFSGSVNWASLTWVFIGSVSVFFPFARGVQWTFKSKNRAVLYVRLERALTALLGQLEQLEVGPFEARSEGSLLGLTDVRSADTRISAMRSNGREKLLPSDSTPDTTPDTTPKAIPEILQGSSAKTNLASIQVDMQTADRQTCIDRYNLSERQVEYLNTLAKCQNNKALAKHFGVNKSEVKRMLESIYDLTGISSLRLSPVPARAKLMEWIQQHGFGSEVV